MENIYRQDLVDMMDAQRDLELIEVLPQDQYREFHIPGAEVADDGLNRGL